LGGGTDLLTKQDPGGSVVLTYDRRRCAGPSNRVPSATSSTPSRGRSGGGRGEPMPVKAHHDDEVIFVEALVPGAGPDGVQVRRGEGSAHDPGQVPGPRPGLPAPGDRALRVGAPA